MSRRLVAVLATFVLCLANFAVTASAATRIEDREPAIRLDSAQGCQDTLVDNDHVSSNHYGNSTSGVRAWIDPDSSFFEDCDPILTDAVGGASAWVALVSDEGSGFNLFGDSGYIVQIGVIDCHATPITLGDCDDHIGNGVPEPFYFWAGGGCGTQIAYPRYINPANFGAPGANPGGNSGFKITRDATYFHLYVDFAPANGSFTEVATLPRSQSGLSCWAGSALRPIVAYERLDEGDSAGISIERTDYTSMQWSASGTTGWTYFTGSDMCNWNGTGGEGHTASSHCVWNGTTSTMQVWD